MTSARLEPPSSFAGVLHVFTGNRYGGIETMLATMARSPLFHGQTYALVSRGRLFDELGAAKADVLEIGPFRARRPWQARAVRKRLSEILAARSIHTVVTHMSIPHALAAPVVGSRALVYYAHEVHRGRHWSERWARRARRPDLVIAGSAFDATGVPALFPEVSSADVSVVYYATDLGEPGADDERAEVRRELTTPLDHRVIVCAARMTPYKGQDVLIEALGRLRGRPGLTAWIAGGAQTPAEARFEKGLRERASALGLGERVRFLGERNDVPRLLRAADLHCQPNTGPEPFGICFVEALWAGLPVVTSAIGGALEILTPEFGELVPPSKVGALAEALERCMDDAEKARAVRLRGPARAQSFCSPQAFARRMSAALARARDATSGRGPLHGGKVA
jgi:glycosyltransferase involved in cell wall biosynthesis